MVQAGDHNGFIPFAYSFALSLYTKVFLNKSIGFYVPKENTQL